MKKLSYLLLPVTCYLLLCLAGCTQKGNPTSGESSNDSISSDSVALIQDYDSLVSAEAKAALDSSFAQSDEYKAAHEAYTQILESQTQGLNEAEAALFELEVASKSLYENGKHFASNVSEMRNPINQQRMRITAEKARQLGEKVRTMTLTADQQQLFDSLKTIIHLP